jgi:hypothetical protein
MGEFILAFAGDGGPARLGRMRMASPEEKIPTRRLDHRQNAVNRKDYRDFACVAEQTVLTLRAFDNDAPTLHRR